MSMRCLVIASSTAGGVARASSVALSAAECCVVVVWPLRALLCASQEADPCIKVMFTYTEEGKKVERNAGPKLPAVFVRVSDAQTLANAVARGFWTTSALEDGSVSAGAGAGAGAGVEAVPSSSAATTAAL